MTEGVSGSTGVTGITGQLEPEQPSDVILVEVKKKIGVAPHDTAFDLDIMTTLNGVFSHLHQLGVGPDSAFQIVTGEETWSQFYTDPRLAMVEPFVYGKTRLWFDPPVGSLLTALQELVAEYEWRLTVAAETIRDEVAE